jgi:hypothetical protein
MNGPRDLVQRFEKNPQLPKGDGEILFRTRCRFVPVRFGRVEPILLHLNHQQKFAVA